MLWILEKEQKSRFNLTEECMSECGGLINCLESNAALIIHAVILVNQINKCGVTDTLPEIKSLSRCLKSRYESFRLSGFTELFVVEKSNHTPTTPNTFLMSGTKMASSITSARMDKVTTV